MAVGTKEQGVLTENASFEQTGLEQTGVELDSTRGAPSTRGAQ